MVGKEFKSRFDAAVIAAAMAFSSLSGALPGGKAFAEENAATDVLAAQDKEEERITVSGNILNAKKAQIFEIEFYSSFSWDEDDWDDDGVCREDVVVVVAKDGKYSAQLEKNRNYYVDVRLGGDNIWIKDPDNDDDGVLVKTQEEDMTFNFEIVEAFNCNIEGDVVSDFDRSDLLEVLDGASVIISGEEYSKTVKLSKNNPYFDVADVPVGSYDITLKGKTGNTYCVQPFTFEYGYGVDGPPEEVILDASYGNYEDRDFNGRIICSFADLTAADYSDVDFYFVDSYNNRSGKYSYLELKCGLVWLPNGETYKLVAEGLPEALELNYDKMGDFNLTEDYCNDTYYNYTVSVKKANPEAPLSIVKDIEDVVAYAPGEKCEFKIEATGVGLTYTWYYKEPADSRFYKTGCKTDTYAKYASKTKDGTEVYCVVRDSNGNSIVSRTATLSLASISYPDGTSIVSKAGKNVTFRISYSAEDELTTYRWYYCIPESAGGDGKFHKSQCTTTEYTKVASKKTNGMQAYCVVTASNGKKINSEKISLQVK